jgi:hypothetical protein
VAVLVQESGKHGGEAAGPVVRDVIKAYYDKKAKRTEGQYTAEEKHDNPGRALRPVAAIQHQRVSKSDGQESVLPPRPTSTAEPR